MLITHVHIQIILLSGVWRFDTADLGLQIQKKIESKKFYQQGFQIWLYCRIRDLK